MDKIEDVINLFLEPYLADNNIQAAILTGSYAQGNQNKYSDIDIFIISSDTLNWRERGTKIFSNYSFEYFINPPKIIIKEMEELKSMATVVIIANGKEIFDKTGIVKQLKEKAFRIIKNPIDPINNIEIEMIKYYLNNHYDQLTRAYEIGTNEFHFLYYTYLEYIIYSYGKYNGIALSPKTKIYQYIFDEEYYLNKDLKKIDDNNFLEILKRCMKNNKNEIMYKNITELKNYLLNLVGGFNIDGWKMRGKIE
jgi:Icc-related predicted phosphoesterase